MPKFTIILENPAGLHTRPGNQFVKLAKTFGCGVTVTKNEKTFSGKSLMKLMKAGISTGDEITVECAGEGEDAAAAELKAFIENLEE